MVDVGKAAKRMGIAHPRVHRRTDPAPARYTPGHDPSTATRKFWGYRYQFRRLDHSLATRTRWFHTQTARDQSMSIAERAAKMLGYTFNYERCDR